MQSYARATSGLAVAQAGLYTTGHNMSNAGTAGYSRQRVNITDSAYLTIGFTGTSWMKMGLGAQVRSTTQLRDEFLDKTYRKAVSKASFHDMKYDAINEVENILGELHGDARLSKCIDDLWSSIQELTTHPDGMETRSMFITSAKAFLNKTDEIANGLYEYQLKLNNEIIQSVNRINVITTQIEDLNKKIMLNESAGDNANDYRDTRNSLIDELSRYGELEVTENEHGGVTILMEGKDLVSNGSARILGLRYASPEYPFLEPVFDPDYVRTGKILKHDDYARQLFSNLDGKQIGGLADNDYGSLKSLMLLRGNKPANYTSSEKEVANYTIPKFQRELDILFNKIISMVNDMMAPDKTVTNPPAPYNLDGQQYIELFKRKTVDRYNADGTIYEGDPSKPYTLYSMGNIEINPVIFNNFNKLCLSESGDRADTKVMERMLEAWKGDYGNYLPSFSNTSTKLSFDAFYRQLVTNLGEEGSTSKTYVDAQNKIVSDTEAARQQISGVALDEELTEMMKFQHAYNAASKMINVIDNMLDEIIRLK